MKGNSRWKAIEQAKKAAKAAALGGTKTTRAAAAQRKNEPTPLPIDDQPMPITSPEAATEQAVHQPSPSQPTIHASNDHQPLLPPPPPPSSPPAPLSPSPPPAPSHHHHRHCRRPRHHRRSVNRHHQAQCQQQQSPMSSRQPFPIHFFRQISHHQPRQPRRIKFPQPG